MFRRIFVESDIKDLPKVQKIAEKFPRAELVEIATVEEVFGKVRKPYLHKRTSLDLFLGRKRGELVKRAPDAYGPGDGAHFYFIHAYNCIYECDYCYLQGRFHSPDIVMFLNHDEIVQEMERILTRADTPVHFYAGEFSDSLALSHIEDSFNPYFDFFAGHPEASLELRTKSANIAALLKYPPLPNAITAFSLSPEDKIRSHDLKTPLLNHRLKAAKTLQRRGYPTAFHFDPIIYDEDIVSKYGALMDAIGGEALGAASYFSLGVVRFTKPVYAEVGRNYPEHSMPKPALVADGRGLIRYRRPLRLWLMNRIKGLLIDRGVAEERIYLCME